ncbi:MAG: PLD nuclease N-terminal domain-containing protein [Nakamurella sp.]
MCWTDGRRPDTIEHVQNHAFTTLSTSTMLADGGSKGLPVALLILFGVIALALLILFVAAVLSILRSDRLSDAGKAIWIVACLILQFFGPLVWFGWGRKQSFDRRDGSAGPVTRA